MFMAVVLIGMMGSGKSSVGRTLAKQLGWVFVDLDHEIEKSAGKSVAKFFSDDGEQAFRRLESERLRRIDRRHDLVLSVGGGAPLKQDNFEVMREIGTVVYLRARLETILERVQARPSKRPLLAENPEVKTRELLESRKAVYEQAEYTVDVDGTPLKVVAERIRSFLGE